MNRDQAIGALVLVASVAGILVYAWLVLFSPWTILILQLTALIAVGGVLGILAWMGYALATTPPPKPIEETEQGDRGGDEEERAGDEGRG
ncbi:MAG: transcriptional regulator [Nitrososphaerota archaeon]